MKFAFSRLLYEVKLSNYFEACMLGHSLMNSDCFRVNA